MDLNRHQKVMLLQFCAYGFLKNLQFFGPFLLLFFTVSKGLSYTQFGLLVAIREVTVYLLEIPTGIVADVTGRRRAMVFAFASYLVAFALFSATASFWVFALAMVMFGAGEAFRSGTHKSMIMQHLDLEGLRDLRVHYYGTTRAASRLGSALAVLLAGVLVFAMDSYETIFIASMVPYVFGLLLMLTYPAELDGETECGLPVRAALRHTVSTFRNIFKTSELTKLLLNASAMYSFFKVAKDYLQAILKTAATGIAAGLPFLAFAQTDTQRAALLISAVYFVIHLNEFYSSRKAGHVTDRVGDLGRALNTLFWVFAGAFALTGTFLLLSEMALGWVGTAAGTALAILMLFFFYTLVNLRTPIVVGFLSDRTDAQQRATVLSVDSQLRAIMAAIIAPAFGLIADGFGVPYAFLIGGAVLVLLGLLLRLSEHQSIPSAGPSPGA